MIPRCFVLVAGLVAAMALAACDRQPPEAPSSSTSGATAVSTGDAKPYPLKVCIVSGEALGSMGEPVVRVHEGQEVKFCCDGCVEDFTKDPAKYLAKLSVPAAGATP